MKTLESSRGNLDVALRVPSIPQAASPTRSLRGPNAVWNKVIWVTSPDNKPFDHTATLPIQIFPEDHNGLGHDPWLAKAYSITSFRVYPNESEAMQEREKLGNIGVLDEVARSSPPKFAWRPKTCLGIGACVPRDCDKTVHRRAHGGCATHVRVVDEKDHKHKEHEHVTECGERYQLTCDPGTHTLETPSHRGGGGKNTTSKKGQSSKKQKQSDKKPEHWFHQEIVPSLPNCELRVFIATEPGEEDIRGRTGRILISAKTAFVKGQALAVRKFLPEDLVPGLTQSGLESFALFIFRRLRERANSMVFFESLEVGVRLNIGVADNGGVGKSFVSEITRWYGAHYFSLHLSAEPKTQICKAFGYAFSAFLNGSTGGVS
ncbi:hypothetical protein AG0111_0g11824 [Alternaria gaisen]|uniref:Uncharacterized protein n=1 Tax=Alternaria gaisen TaxID=167740 RepID=A0ACB6F6Q5_9PLEO|nr:hypothetical protein AG0111_0g11824 [Alternaria gaisen]